MSDKDHTIAAQSQRTLVKSRRQSEALKSRKDKILDTAEQQFARHGYDGLTLRTVARKAGVDVALPSYHFGSKRGLFDAVLLRRADYLNAVRLKALAEAEVRAKVGGRACASVEDVIDAFLRPILDRSADELRDEGWIYYYELVAFVNSSHDWGGVLMSKYFDPLATRFLDALKKALPAAAPEDLYWCYHFLSGALTLTFAQTERIDHLSKGLCRSDDLRAACSRMVPFVVAGFEALCLEHAKADG